MCHCEDSEHGEEDEAISLKLGDSHKPHAMTAKVFVSAWRKGFFCFNLQSEILNLKSQKGGGFIAHHT